jgi:hypothetical protein
MPIQSEKTIFADCIAPQSAPGDSVPLSAGVVGSNLLQKITFSVESGYGSMKIEFYVFLLGVWTKVTGSVTVTVNENDNILSKTVMELIKNTSATDVVLPVLTEISGIGAKATCVILGSNQ